MTDLKRAVAGPSAADDRTPDLGTAAVAAGRQDVTRIALIGRRHLGLGIAALVLALHGSEASSQTTQLNLLMRSKLQHSQRVLEAVVTSNWALLGAESRALERITADPAWTVLQFPEYARHSAAFVRATTNLAEAAEQRDLESASLGFVALSTSCVSCHRYLARARVVAAPVGRR